MRRPIVILTLLALIWGASFMFIKIAVRELAPATLILGRVGIGALLLALIAFLRLGPRGRRRDAPHVAGSSWSASSTRRCPFWLLSWGETRIDSGLASIIQGAVPIFNALLAFAFFREERVTGLRLVGLAIGFVGVALLVGAQPQGKLLGALAVVAMALCYAIGTLLAGRHLARHASARRGARVDRRVDDRDAPARVIQAPAEMRQERRSRRSSSSASSARRSHTSSSTRSSSAPARTTRLS